jgi:flagellar basal body-associated protein FliL
MHTNKGYIIPLISVIILLILAGVFLFTGKKLDSPVVEEKPASTTPVVEEPATTTPYVPEQATSTPIDITASTTVSE